MLADRATAAIWRCAARALGVPLPVLRRARLKAERDWTRASRRLDAIVAAQDALKEER